ncbi:MAG: MBL fold metallo-hydrolase [Rhodobacteraceae bacterium]|nr:MBL fold metallo-hydrolase [Paracoccaceae bacterium]
MRDPFERNHNPRIGQALALQPGLRVVTAGNSSPMTFTGTQTYLLGTGAVAVIDPGPEDDAHLEALLGAIAGAEVSHILVTHNHLDHSPLSRRLSAVTGAPVLAFGQAHEARSPVMERLAAAGALGGKEGIDADFSPDRKLTDGQVVDGDGWTVRAVHTPGHLSNHLCFAWEEQGAVFTGDHVMGWATTMVSPPDGDLTEFMRSMARLQDRGDDRIYYPGHGGAIARPLAMVAHQISHRQNREVQILETLKQGGGTPSELAAKIYTDVDPRLLPAATRNVLAHLIDLSERGHVTGEGEITQATRFSAK